MFEQCTLRSLVFECENRANVIALGPAGVQSGLHYAYAGGIVGQIRTEDNSALLGPIILMFFGINGFHPAIMGGSDFFLSGYVKNCVNWGTVEAYQGFNSYAGGIVGECSFGDIINSLNLSSVYSETYAGSIAGGLYNCTLTNCYYFENTAAQAAGKLDFSVYVSDSERTATPLNLEELASEELAEKLGDGFVIAENDKDGKLRPVIITIMDGRNNSQEIPVIKLITVANLVSVVKICLGYINIAEEQIPLYDMNDDGAINIIDNALMRRRLITNN